MPRRTLWVATALILTACGSGGPGDQSGPVTRESLAAELCPQLEDVLAGLYPGAPRFLPPEIENEPNESIPERSNSNCGIPTGDDSNGDPGQLNVVITGAIRLDDIAEECKPLSLSVSGDVKLVAYCTGDNGEYGAWRSVAARVNNDFAVLLSVDDPREATEDQMIKAATDLLDSL